MNITIFGDSIVWGANDYEKGGWVERLKMFYMEQGRDIDVYNNGIPGDKTEDLLKRFDIEAEVREPDIIIFSVGVNDSQYMKDKKSPRVSIDQFEKNLMQLITKARKFTNKIAFVSLTRVNEIKTIPVEWSETKCYDNKSIEKYEVAIKSVCKKEVIIILNIPKDLSVNEWVDGLHPEANDHQRIFESIKSQIESIFFN